MSNEALTAPYPSEEYGFGIWADRVDISEDSVEYVNKIREQSDKKDLPDIIIEAEGSENTIEGRWKQESEMGDRRWKMEATASPPSMKE